MTEQAEFSSFIYREARDVSGHYYYTGGLTSCGRGCLYMKNNHLSSHNPLILKFPVVPECPSL